MERQGFHGGIVFSGIPLLGDGHERGSDPLAPTRLQARFVQIRLKVRKQRLDHHGVGQRSQKQPGRLAIWDATMASKPDEPHNRKSVQNLVVGLIIKRDERGRAGP